MKKFEYKCISIFGGSLKTTAILNEYGKEGWELIAVYGLWYFLKRSK